MAGTAVNLVRTKVFVGADAETRLRELNIDSENLRQIVVDAELGRADATDYDPINWSALLAYSSRVRGFREHHCPLGWTVDRTGGVEATRSPCRKLVVITRAGDEGVGDPLAFPQPKCPTGTGTRDIAYGGLALDPDWLNSTSVGALSYAAWMLLVYRRDDEVRYELSRFSDIEKGNVLGWHERILFSEIDLTESAPPTAPPGDEEIDVPVVRKR